MPVLTTPAVLFGQVYIPAIEAKQNGFELGKKSSGNQETLNIQWHPQGRWAITGYPKAPSEGSTRTYSFLKSQKWNPLLKEKGVVSNIKLYMVSPKHIGSPWLFNYFIKNNQPYDDKPIKQDEIPVVITNEDGQKDLEAFRKLEVDTTTNWPLTIMLHLFKEKFYFKQENWLSFRPAELSEIDAWVEKYMTPAQ